MSRIQRFIVDGHIGFCKKKYKPLEKHFMNNLKLQIISEWHPMWETLNLLESADSIIEAKRLKTVENGEIGWKWMKTMLETV